MDKWLALFALSVLHVSLARSPPENAMATAMECQQMTNPTPEKVLHSRRMIQVLDDEFHKCCLQKRSIHRDDNCMACDRSSSQGAAVESQEDVIRIAWDTGCKRKTHTRDCITQRPKIRRENWGKK